MIYKHWWVSKTLNFKSFNLSKGQFNTRLYPLIHSFIHLLPCSSTVSSSLTFNQQQNVLHITTTDMSRRCNTFSLQVRMRNKIRLKCAVQRSWKPNQKFERQTLMMLTCFTSQWSCRQRWQSTQFEANTEITIPRQQAPWWMSYQKAALTAPLIYPYTTGPTAASHCSSCCHSGLILPSHVLIWKIFRL